jgi:eukaryotic-like serine/threonine-protein kinase
MGRLGAGGMGEVYRARDGRLKREVALKVLHAAQHTPEHVQRFTREARAAGALNHPNILAVFDVGVEGEIPYVVSELLEGESLRHRLDRGAIPCRKALEYAIQVAHALAAAHDKGICHRDVKPGNVFILADGRVKLLDFGLAKLDDSSYSDASDETTASAISRAGMVFGTVGYMAPEQVLGETVDHRADVFSLGAVLYEMLTGARAFQRATSVETMTAILREDPVSPLELNPTLPVAVVGAVRRCLEKNRGERFQSARDLAFHLAQLDQSTTGVQARTLARRARNFRLVWTALAAAALVGVGWLIWQQLTRQPPSFRQLTFRRGRIGGAYFVAGGGVVYSQTTDGGIPDVFMISSQDPLSRRKLNEGADVLAARGNLLALSFDRKFVVGQRFSGTLARGDTGGGTAPQPIVSDPEVENADWDPTGDKPVVVRSLGASQTRLEYNGQELCRVSGSIQNARFSPDGRQVAFLAQSQALGRGGSVGVVDLRSLHCRFLTQEWANANGLAWHPDGKEVWFTATSERQNRSLLAVDLRGHQRLVWRMAGSLTLWDVAAEGALLARDDERLMVRCAGPHTPERDLSLSTNTSLAALSSDGKLFLTGDLVGGYLVPTNGREPTPLRIPDVRFDDLSSDEGAGRRVLADSLQGDSLLVSSTNGMDAQRLRFEGLKTISNARWFPKGNQIFFRAEAMDGKARSYVLDLPGGSPRELTRPGTWAISVSPDGLHVAAIGPRQPISIWPVGETLGTPRDVPGSREGDRPEAWHRDGRALWVVRRENFPVTVQLVDLETNGNQVKAVLDPPDVAGVYSLDQFRITPSGDTYCYSYRQILSELYLVTGLR